MYERSASVLERYFEKYFELNKDINIKKMYEDYKILIEEINKYQIVIEEEEELIKGFDDIAKKIETIQKTQEKLYLSNQKLEDERTSIFGELDGNPEKIKDELKKIENKIDENNEEIKKIDSDFVEGLETFIEKQKERNKSAKERRITENSYVEKVEKIKKDIENFNEEILKKLKNLIQNSEEIIKEEINEIMIKNGKNEKIGFNKEVIQKAVNERFDIAKREAECYIEAYEKLKKLLGEIENGTVKMAKYQKTLRDTKVRLEFLNTEKDYIADFLDNERLTVINGQKRHEKLMEEACENFEIDIKQINNLYDLIIREIMNKATKKTYTALYNCMYLKNIEDKEKNFEKEMTNIKFSIGTVINSNYWRIAGIKNIYDVFQKEVSENFERDLSEYQINENDEEENSDTQTEEVKKENTNKKAEKISLKIEKESEEDENDYEQDEENYEENEDDIEEDQDDYNEYEDDYDEDENDYDEDDYEEDEDDDEENEDDYDEDDYEEDEDDDEENEDDYDEDDYEEDDYDFEIYDDFEEDEDIEEIPKLLQKKNNNKSKNENSKRNKKAKK